MANAERDVIFLGDRSNKKQAVVSIPAKTTANMPGVLNLQSVSGTTVTDRKLFITSAGNDLRVTSGTTFADGDGASLASSGANVTLSNLSGTVAIPITIASDTANTDDLGADPKSWRTLYWTTSLVKVGTTWDVTLAATEPAAASYVYTFPDAGASANVMLDTGAATAITYTKSTANITLGAAAQFNIAAAGNVDFGTGTYNFVGGIDVATGKSVDINMDVTIGGGAFVTSAACTLDQDLQKSTSPTFVGLTLSGAVATITTLAMSGALSGATTGGFSGLVTATGGVTVNADNAYVAVGGSGTSDSKIYFDGANLCFWDAHVATVYTLNELATGTTLNPTVVGDLTVGDGKFNWTDAADEVAAAWSFASIGAGSDIDITSSVDSGECIHIVANSLTTGKVFDTTTTSIGAAGAIVYLQATAIGHNATGLFIECNNAAADVFTVGKYGATVIAGNASGTDALTLTAGDILLTAGNLDMTIGNLTVTDGNLTVATIQNIVHKISRNNASATAAVLEVEETNTAGDVVLLIDSKHTGAVDAAQITYSGTASGLNITTSVVTGLGITIAGPAAQTFPQIRLDGTIGTGWGGAANTGMLHLALDGATLATTASAIQVVIGTGTTTDASLGYVLKVADTTTAPANPASTYAGYMSTTCNSLFLATTNALASALTLDGPAAQTAAMMKVNVATNNWQGAANVGAIHIAADAAFANVAATEVYLASSAAIDDSRGHLLRIIDSSAVTGTMGYPVFINSNDAQEGGLLITTHASGTALAVSAGITNLDGNVYIGGIPFFDQAADTCTDSAAASLTTAVTYLVTTGAAIPTLADGAQGQIKIVTMKTDAGDATFTPTNALGFTTCKFTNIGQTATFIFLDSKWRIMGQYGCTVA